MFSRPLQRARVSETGRPGVLRRKGGCGACAKSAKPCAKCQAQREGEQGPTEVPERVPQVLSEPGAPLDAAVRRDMEARFGHDFSRVRVHTDARAADSARDVQALAYTVGDHIVFGREQYAPQGAPGRRLLAHELAHVVQQQGSGAAGAGAGMPARASALEVEASDSPAEREADAMADAVTGAGRLAVPVAKLSAPSGGALARLQRDVAPAPAAAGAGVSCTCDAKTQVAYDAETYKYIRSIASLITSISSAQGVSAVAVAGAIADEYNTRRGARSVVDAAQDATVSSLPEWAIDVDRFFDIKSKLLNTLENDVGPANIKVRTALEYVQTGELSVPGSPKSSVQVTKIIEFLLSNKGTVTATAAVIARAQKLFGPSLGSHSKELRDSIYVEYFKQGDSYYKRFSASLAANPSHKACPGEGGCRAFFNYSQLETALKPPPPASTAPAPAPAAGVTRPSPPPPGSP
jgi:hypothetical protein